MAVHTRRLVGPILALTLTSGLAVAGCGGDSETGSPGTATVTGTATKAATITKAATVTEPASTTETGTGPGSTCDTVVITPNSSDGFFDILVSGISCADAEPFLRSIADRTSPTRTEPFTQDGFRCRQAEIRNDGMPTAAYECEKAGVSITFERS